MEDPYENGEGSEVWTTRECMGERRIPSPVSRCYQRLSPGSRESSRSGTPVEPESPRISSSPRLSGRGSVYVLPSPPLKRWLRDQSRTSTDDVIDFMTEEQFERMFTIRRSDWIFQFAELPIDSPSIEKIRQCMLESYNPKKGSQLLMIYSSDARSAVVKIDGCHVAEGGDTVGIRGSLLRYIILTLSYRGIRVRPSADDAEPYCESRVERGPRCLETMRNATVSLTTAAWASFLLEPPERGDMVKLRILVHALC